ncbi:MAG: hypothetical protein IKO32_01285 [Lachnospiraceae bacterium]|nr:hypothetical protein [Lachnospiraceae bacterium]
MRKKITALLLAGSAMTMILAGCNGGKTKLNTQASPSVDDVIEARIAEELAENNPNYDLADSEEISEADSEETARQSGINEDAPEPEESSEPVVLSTTEGIDVDLTILSSTMVYSQVYDMVSRPENYEGKIVRMQGYVGSYEDTITGNKYYGCIIQDATACCSQGIEFVLKEGYEYPANDEDVIVTGEFGTYEEDGFLYCTLKDAVLEEEKIKKEDENE